MSERRPPSLAPRVTGSPSLPEQPWEPVTRRKPHERAPEQRRGAVPARKASRQAPPAPDTVTLRMKQRLAERKRTERRRAAVRAVRWVAVAGVLAAAVWAVLASPVFSVQSDRIELIGLSSEIDEQAVRTVVNSTVGDSVALLNVGSLEHRLGDVTGVRDATVERVWPSGLRVTLVARHPVAAIPNGDGFTLIDADAVEVGTVTQAPADLPVMTVPVGNERVLDAVLEVMRNLPSDTLARVSGIGAQTEDSVSFTLNDGPRVDWGSKDDSALKAQVLQAMIASGAANGVAVVDVSAPTLPITKAQP